VLDTVPVTHATGSRIWFAEYMMGEDRTEWVDTDIVDVKLTPTTSLGTLAVADATERTITLANRAARPYAPGNVKINDERYPTTVVGDIVVTWSHRDRLLQTVSLIGQTATDIGPEPGVTYTLRLYDGAMLVDEQTGLTGTAYTFLAPVAATKIELLSVRDGFESWQTHSIEFAHS
jgi:hypothetical protein